MISFNPAPAVVAGTVYAIVLYSAAGPNKYGWLRTTIGAPDLYAAGHAWQALAGMPPFAWNFALYGTDFAFKTYVRDPQADLVLTLEDAPDPIGVINIGGPSKLTYTITVTNNGPSVSHDVVVANTLPSGLTYDSASSSQGACSVDGVTVTCALGDLDNAAEATITILAKATQSGSQSNTATVSATTDDPDVENNAATTTTRVSPFCFELGNVRLCP